MLVPKTLRSRLCRPQTSDYYAGLDGPNIIHTLGNFARLPLDEPDEPVPPVTTDEHNNTIHASSARLPQQSLRVGDRVTLPPNFYVENSRANGAVYQLSGMESFGDIDQIPRVQGARFGPGPSHGPTR